MQIKKTKVQLNVLDLYKLKFIIMFIMKIGVKNTYTQFSRQARNDNARGHFEFVEKVRLITLTN